MDTANVFARLAGSTKFLVALVAIVAVVVLAALGKYSSADAVAFVKWIVTAWLGAQAVQVGAEKVAAALSDPSEK
jgi:hypothetical protein